MRWVESLGYHALIALSTAAIVLGSVPFLKIIAVHVPGHGLQEAISS